MEHLELDEIDRLISKLKWERFQLDMDTLEYRRRNSNLEHRIKMLHLQINVPKVTISKNIPACNKIDYEMFELKMRNAIQLAELKQDKITKIEENYHCMVHDIHTNSNEIIGMFENLSIVKKKRYFENEIQLMQQKVDHLDNFITVSKQQLNEIQYNREHIVRNFVIESVMHWKSVTILHKQIQHFNSRLKELCNEIGIIRNDTTIMENRVAEIRKVFKQLKMEMELIHSQVPRMIAKLPIIYNSLEQDDDRDSSSNDSPPNSFPDLKAVKPADTIYTPQLVLELDEDLKNVDDINTHKDNGTVLLDTTRRDIQKNEVISQNTAKTEKSTKRRITTDDDKPISPFENRSLLKKLKITSDRRDISIKKTVDFNRTPKAPPPVLRNNSIPMSPNKPSQSNKKDEVAQLSQILKKLSPKHLPELDSFASKNSSLLAPDCDIPLLSNFQPNQSNFDSFLLNTSGHGSRRTSTDSKEDDFFITNEGDAFNFFQPNENDQQKQLFSM